jgi:hypothetical protein
MRERLPLCVASKVLGPCVHLRLARAAHSMATVGVLKHTVDRAVSLGPVCTVQTILVDRGMEASSVPPDKAIVVPSTATAEALKHTVDRAVSLGPVCTAQTILVDRGMEASSVPPDKAIVVPSTATAEVLSHTVGKDVNQELVEGKESSLQASTSPAVTLV